MEQRLIKSHGRSSSPDRQRILALETVMFLVARDGKVVHMREYFDPTRAAKSMNEAILDLEPWF